MRQHFGIVRDKNTGKPRVDDPAQLHPIQLGMMTKAEREEIGVHSGPWALTADGPMPVDRKGADFVVKDKPLRACGQIIEPGDEPNQTVVWRVTPRTDHQTGKIISGTLQKEA